MRHALSPPCGSPLPPLLLTRLAAVADLFTRPTWSHVLWLVAGAALAPGRRTVTATLRILGREQESDFGIYHRILSRARWSARVVARQLLHLLVRTFLSADAPVVIGFDDTIERRWGHKIRARGIYRDPVRSSKGHFVKASGLRWLSAMLLAPVPWAGRVLALPFLTVLAPSERFYAAGPRAPKALLDWARQIALQIRRWLPGRSIVLVLDGAFAALEFLAAVRAQGLHHHAPAPGCEPVCSRTPAPQGTRAPSAQGQAAAQARSAPRRSGNALAAPHRRALVRPHQPPGRDRHRNRALVSRRPAAPADPLAPGARPDRRARYPRLPGHRSRRHAARHAAVVRPALADRGHVRGSPRPPRHGNPTPMVRSRHPAHHPGAARPLLAHVPVGP